MTDISYPNLLRFDLSGEQISQLADQIIEKSRNTLNSIVSRKIDFPTWENTIQPLLDEDFEYSSSYSNCYFVGYVSADKSIRDASVAANKKLSEYSIEKSYRKDVYQFVKRYTEENPNEDLDAEQKYVLEKIMKDFKRIGLHLSDEEQEKLKAIKKEMAECRIKFQQNINEDNTTLQFTREELDGMSDDFIDNLKKEGDKYIVSLKYPEMFPVLKKCKVEETRKRISIARGKQCVEVNIPLIERLVELRIQEAELLGFKNHAEYVLDINMAKSPEKVFSFLNNLVDKLEDGLNREMANLLELKRKEKEELGLKFDGILHPHDINYYNEMDILKNYNLDHELISEYFPLEHVTKTILDIYQEIFSLRFEPTPNPHVWHEEVSQYSVFDKESGEFIGHFYLDLYPRDGKYTHAAKFSLIKTCLLNGERVRPAAAMVANFTKPTSDKPSLLKHNEVVTFLHEAGHVFHEILSKCKYSIVSGTSVQRDFVEAPSQMLENWAYEKEALMRLSKHYKTGEPLPNELIESIIKAKNANIAIFLRRQLFFGIFDMRLHTHENGMPINTYDLWHKTSKEIMKITPYEDTNGLATFGHMAGGYSAGYYGYLWSEVYSADIFMRFKNEGIFNTELGKEYRRKILEKGGSQDALDLLKDFLGREPNEKAFLKHIGLE